MTLLFFYFDPLYFIILAPGLLLSVYATMKTKSAFRKYSAIPCSLNLIGAKAAEKMLYQAGVMDCKIIEGKGFLTDHYNPATKTLVLSRDVFHGKSLSSIGIACHEAGHALQHAQGYAMLKLRSAMVPMTNISSSLSWIFIFAGIILNNNATILAGVILFSVMVLFSLVTLPVEWDASARAKKVIINGFLPQSEIDGVGKVLNAAFLTYLASAITAVLTLLYYLYRLGLLGNREN